MMTMTEPHVDGGEAAGPEDRLRRRIAAARDDRDDAVAELREVLSDEEILEEFGIDVHRLG